MSKSGITESIIIRVGQGILSIPRKLHNKATAKKDTHNIHSDLPQKNSSADHSEQSQTEKN